MTRSGTGESQRKKADGVADAINRLLQNLVIKCAKSEGVRDYYYVGVLGYGSKVGPAFGGSLAGKELAPISEIADNPARVEERTKKVDDGAGGILDQTVKFPDLVRRRGARRDAHVRGTASGARPSSRPGWPNMPTASRRS